MSNNKVPSYLILRPNIHSSAVRANWQNRSYLLHIISKNGNSTLCGKSPMGWDRLYGGSGQEKDVVLSDREFCRTCSKKWQGDSRV
jgi:hypothetical protein